jgi:hypothetical protein
VSFNPTADEQAAGVPVRFGGRADTVVFPHIPVTPTAGWADVTAVRKVFCLKHIWKAFVAGDGRRTMHEVTNGWGTRAHV